MTHPSNAIGFYKEKELNCSSLQRNVISLKNERIITIYLNNRHMEYKKPIVLVKSQIELADCKNGPCGRPSCAAKPSGKH